MKYIKLFEDYLDKILKISEDFDYEEIPSSKYHKRTAKNNEEYKSIPWEFKQISLIVDVLNKLKIENKGLIFNNDLDGIKRMATRLGEVIIVPFHIRYDAKEGSTFCEKTFHFFVNRLKNDYFLVWIKYGILNNVNKYYECDEIEGLIHLITDYVAIINNEIIEVKKDIENGWEN